jgi:hypothetical protein
MTPKVNQLILIENWAGAELVDGSWQNIPWKENDPNRYSNSRFLKIDSVGCANVAIRIYSNPHQSSWGWTWEKIVLDEISDDWFTSPNRTEDDRVWQRINSDIYFAWELTYGMDPYTDKDYYEPYRSHSIGASVKGRLVGPHIDYGDWIVEYECPDGRWITRVVNERQMWERKQ